MCDHAFSVYRSALLAARAEHLTQGELVERAIRAYLARSAMEEVQPHLDQAEVLTALNQMTTITCEKGR